MERRKLLLGSSMVSLLVIGVICGILFMPELLQPFGSNPRMWHVLAADANPGSGQCGIINIYIYPHQSDTTVYNNNISEANAYAHFDSTPSLNESLEGNVPYNTPFDIVVKVQFNYTVAFNVTSGSWDADYVRGLITCADLGIAADTVMSESSWFNITGNNAGDTAWIHFYMNNGGSGYQIAHGEKVNVTSLVIQGYY